jgi:Fe(3+) dicitrate transport protein
VAAGFVEGRLAAGALAVAPGLRFEHVRHDISNRFPGREVTMPQSYSRWLPGIGATLRAFPAATLFAGLHRGFAPPRPADLYRPEPGQPIVLLDPETSWNSEVGGRLAPRPGVQAEITLFRTDFQNQVVEAPVSLGQRFVNGGRTLYQGAEMSGGATLPAGAPGSVVSFGGTYTYLPVARFDDTGHRRVEVTGNRLPYAPRHLGSVHGSVLHRLGLMAGLAVEYTSDQFADDVNSVEPSEDGQVGVLPAYAVTNAFTSYRFPGMGVEVRGSIRNLFDHVYITQRNEGIYTGMRRMARVELHWAF